MRDSGFSIIAGTLGDKYIIVEYNGAADLLRRKDGKPGYDSELHADIDTCIQVFNQLKER